MLGNCVDKLVSLHGFIALQRPKNILYKKVGIPAKKKMFLKKILYATVANRLKSIERV